MRVLLRSVIPIGVLVMAAFLSTLVFSRAIASGQDPAGSKGPAAACEASIAAAQRGSRDINSDQHREFPAVDRQVMVIGSFRNAVGDRVSYDCMVSATLEGRYRVSWWKEAGPEVQ